jgi:hypothetical protein
VYGTEGGGHRTIEDYRRDLGAEALARLITFTVVRDPVERLASVFRYLKRGGTTAADRSFRDGPLAPYETLDAFVLGWLTPEAAASQVHLRPQHAFVCNASGTLAVDHVLRHERLAEGYAALRPAIRGAPLPSLDATPGSSARADAELSAPALRITGQVYEQDFSLFGYPFPSL